MNKSDLVDSLADRTGITKADASRAVDALFRTDDGIISRALKKGDRVQITGFGRTEAYHAPNEFAQLSHMQQGFQVLCHVLEQFG